MRTRRWFVPIAGALNAAAWLALLLWQQSPYGRYLDHGNWTEIGLGAGICAALPVAGWALPGVLYVGGWLLMIAAMMLPTVVPLLERFDRLLAPRADCRWVVGVGVAGVFLGRVGFWGAGRPAAAGFGEG